jgi:hypothetical protein
MIQSICRIIPTTGRWLQKSQSLTDNTKSDNKIRTRLSNYVVLVVMSVSSIVLLLLMYSFIIKNDVDKNHIIWKLNIFSSSYSQQDSPNNIILLSSNTSESCATNPIAYIVPDDFGTNVQYTMYYKDRRGVNNMLGGYFNGTLCVFMPDQTRNRTSNSNNTMYTVSFSCYDLYHSGGGTGNFIVTFYSFRHIAQQIGNIDVKLTCKDAKSTKDKLILPWLMGSFPRTYWYDEQEGANDSKTSMITSSLTYRDQSCLYIHHPVVMENSCKSYDPAHMYQDIIFDLRRMAIALVGTLQIEHPAYEWAENNLWRGNDSIVKLRNNQMQVPTPQKYDQPLLSRTEIDDVAFHFRCGDIMVVNTHNYGFMQFQSYSKRLESHRNGFRSIGIVTQPFSRRGQGRKKDQSQSIVDKCHKIVYAFKKYLDEKNYTYNTQDEYGKTKVEKVRVTIRNSKKDYITTAYARMIMAKHVVVTGISTFSKFAALASFANNIYMQRDSDIDFTKLVPSIQITQEAMLSAIDCQTLWEKDNGDTVIQNLMA